MRWLFCLTPPAGGSYNMALDEALMRRAARTGDAVFRVYGWCAPTLSLGRNQRARGHYDREAASRRGVQFVRRPTGGRALLHHREVTYSATLPASGPSQAAAAYHFINSVLLGALGGLGVRAVRASGTTSLPPGLRPCFDVPAEHEIAVDGRKLVGSAQWRHAGALLQHGSILVRDDQALVAELLVQAPAEPTPRAATLADSLGYEPAADDVAHALRRSLDEATSSSSAALEPDAAVIRDTRAAQDQYDDESWTWRR